MQTIRYAPAAPIAEPISFLLLFEEAAYQIHSSMTDSSEENSLQKAAYCLMASSSLREHLALRLEEAEDDKAENLWRWRAVGETMIRDIFATAGEWGREGETGDRGV
jgi:hypothetical protein